MAAPPVLLVADDLTVIAGVKRVLAREGYECVLATSAADAIIAWGHSLPGLILLQPSVESDRGNVVLEELQNHAEAKLLRVVLLGETVPGFPWPVEPLPLETEHLAVTIAENIRTTDDGGKWAVLETTPSASHPAIFDLPREPEEWRATRPQLEADLFEDIPSEDGPPSAAEPDASPSILARAEGMILHGQAQYEARLRAEAAEEEVRLAQAREALGRAENAEELLIAEREARADAQREFQTFKAEVEAAQKEREQAFSALEERFQLETQKLFEAQQALSDRDAEVSLLHKQLEDSKRKVLELENIVELDAEEQGQRLALEDVIRARDEELQAARSSLSEMRTERDDAQTELLALDEARAALEDQLTEARSTNQSLETLRTQVEQLAKYQPMTEQLTFELHTESERRAELEARLQAANVQLQALETAKGTEAQRRAELETRLADQAAALQGANERVQALEAAAQTAAEKVHALEARQVVSLVQPNRPIVRLERQGAVDLQGLARVVLQLVLNQAEVRLDMRVTTGTRSLWFKRGQIIAAASTVELESLIGRARRDGLIDTKQDAELRMLRHGTPRAQLDAVKARGFIRDIEAVPLVQRFTEQVALDAFCETETQYLIAEEAPSGDVLMATVPRPTLPMLAESLRRAVAPDVMLEQLGGGEAVPTLTDAELDLRALGFSERERKMLTWVDGEATVEDLSLASGLKADVAFRALLVAQLLGVLEVRPGTKGETGSSGQLDLHRLEAKYDEVQDADYFTILGLSRASGTDDVRRAYQRLAQEFDPLRFSGHPDPSFQQRALVVSRLLEEAARALEDDRRRQEYARHLLD